jgi:ABC-type nitrate/sulfonate/bicarbonate transport system permease component
VPGILAFIALIGLWELVVQVEVVDFIYLPAPHEIASAFWKLARSGELERSAGHTLEAVALGWLIAMGVGLAIGTLVGISSGAWAYSMSSIEFSRSLPAIAFVPAAVLVFGFSLKMELAVIVFASVWPVIINTVGGVQQVPDRLRDVARTFGLSPLHAILKIQLPAAFPSILVGARLALTTALVLAVISEMIGNPAGLGYALVFTQQALQPAQMWAYIVVIGVLGVLLNSLLVASSRLLPGSRGTQG